MTQQQLYSAYLAWLDGGDPLALEQLFRFPLGNRDVAEDQDSIVNRLYFAAPQFDGPTLRLFLFFEENHLRKAAGGELSVCHSAFFLLDS